MYSAGMFVICLVAMAHSLPSSVEHYEIKRAPFRLHFDPYEETWSQFKQEYGKKYEEEEELMRHDVFLKNVKTIEQHNWQYVNGEKSYYLGINQFTDLTSEEFRQYNKLMKQSIANKTKIHCTPFTPPLNWNLPASVDWRNKGYVTPVKNQGMCGSCWAFSTTGSLEGQHFRKTGKLVSLSEQQLVDCSGSFGNLGCNGGLVDPSFEYINYVGGIESEKEYPYTAEQNDCKFDISKEVADLCGCKDIPTGNEQALAQAVASQGPISVGIDASHTSFQGYAGGVYDEPQCSSTQLDHGVLVVGYGSYKGKEYWLVKNSWGTGWGLQGYIMMSRNKHNQCGIATMASYPEAC